jgi:hypothetical protein
MTFASTPVRLTATVSNGGAVAWSTTGGTLSGKTANAVDFTSATVGSFVVTASSVDNPAKFARITVKVVGKETAIVKGKVWNGTSGIAGVQVRFFQGATPVVVTTSSTGDFALAVNAASTKEFRIDGGTVPGSYYSQFQYDGLEYSTLITSCKAPLPPLAAGKTVSGINLKLSSISGPPPPPPSGCL